MPSLEQRQISIAVRLHARDKIITSDRLSIEGIEILVAGRSEFITQQRSQHPYDFSTLFVHGYCVKITDFLIFGGSNGMSSRPGILSKLVRAQGSSRLESV